ncbi:hypothetical protein KRMM14A1259_56080 [Krasilnikovia sp. MM14-A1259]
MNVTAPTATTTAAIPVAAAARTRDLRVLSIKISSVAGRRGAAPCRVRNAAEGGSVRPEGWHIRAQWRDGRPNPVG